MRMLQQNTARLQHKLCVTSGKQLMQPLHLLLGNMSNVQSVAHLMSIACNSQFQVAKAQEQPCGSQAYLRMHVFLQGLLPDKSAWSSHALALTTSTKSYCVPQNAMRQPITHRGVCLRCRSKFCKDDVVCSAVLQDLSGDSLDG